MDFTYVLGGIGALVIGLVLGVIGGGGSILSVPILVYILAINPVLATAYSLFVVGVSSLIGAVAKAKKGLVDFKTGLIFSVPAFIAVFLTRTFIVPALPEVIIEVFNYKLTKGTFIMVLFAVIMLIAAYSMLKKSKTTTLLEGEVVFNYPVIIIQGFIVGVFTGLVGAGGGFVFIPALVLLAKLPIKKAVGTSLLIIAINSLVGFIGDIATSNINWMFLIGFTSISVIGIFIGNYLSNSIEGKKLKKGFGWFIIVMGITIIVKELAF